MSFVKENPTIEVPGHLSNVSPEKKNYKYPHAYQGNWVDQRYLPVEATEKFYKPLANGSERSLNEFHPKKK